MSPLRDGSRMATDLSYFVTSTHYRVGEALEEAHSLLAESGVQADDVVSIQHNLNSGNFWTISGWFKTRQDQ